MSCCLVLAQKLDTRQSLSQLPVQSRNGHSSIFVMTAAWLSLDDHRKAINYVASYKRAGKYRDVIDFLFAETFGGDEKKGCFNYYNDKGPQARFLYSEARVRWYDHCLLGVCVKAYELFCEERRMKWAEMAEAGREMVLSPKPD